MIFEKISKFFYKTRHLFIMVILAGISASFLGFFYLNGVVQTRDRNLAYELTYEMDATTTLLNNGGVVTQNIDNDRGIYGVVVRLGKGDIIPTGTLNVSVTDRATGDILSTATVPLNSDTVFTEYSGFVLDTPVLAKDNGEYAISFTATLDDSSIPFFLYRSNRFIDYSYSLFENGEEQEGILSARIIYEQSGNFIDKYYFGFSFLFILLGLVSYYLLIVKKFSFIKLYPAIALILGVFYMIILPFMCVPDEQTHFNTAFCYSNMFFGENPNPHPNEVRDWRSDSWWPTEEDQTTPSIFSYKKIAREFTSTATDLTKTERFNQPFNNDIYPVVHWPAMLGIALARALQLGFVPMWLLGRFFNLAFYVALTTMAIRKLPFGKLTCGLIALLPMSLHIAASFNYDAVLISFGLYYVAYILDLAYNEPHVRLKHILALCLFSLLIAPTKGIYFVMIGFIFLIPYTKYPSKKFAIISDFVILCTGALSFSFINYRLLEAYLKTSLGTVTTSAAVLFSKFTLTAGEEIVTVLPNAYALGDIIKSPVWFAQFVIRTFVENIWFYIETTIGGVLGYYNIHINSLWVFGFIIILILSLFAVKDRPVYRLSTDRKIWIYMIFAVFIGMLILVSFQWTTKDLTTLYGIQGRYFLPFLLPLLLTLNSDFITLKRDISNYLIFIAIFMNLAVLTNAFLAII